VGKALLGLGDEDTHADGNKRPTTASGLMRRLSGLLQPAVGVTVSSNNTAVETFPFADDPAAAGTAIQVTDL
jgi:hypothetical protein